MFYTNVQSRLNDFHYMLDTAIVRTKMHCQKTKFVSLIVGLLQDCNIGNNTKSMSVKTSNYKKKNKSFHVCAQKMIIYMTYNEYFFLLQDSQT